MWKWQFTPKRWYLWQFTPKRRYLSEKLKTVIVKQELPAWVMMAFLFKITMSGLTYRSHSEIESSSIPDERIVLVNFGVACNHV